MFGDLVVGQPPKAPLLSRRRPKRLNPGPPTRDLARTESCPAKRFRATVPSGCASTARKTPAALPDCDAPHDTRSARTDRVHGSPGQRALVQRHGVKIGVSSSTGAPGPGMDASPTLHFNNGPNAAGQVPPAAAVPAAACRRAGALRPVACGAAETKHIEHERTVLVRAWTLSDRAGSPRAGSCEVSFWMFPPRRTPRRPAHHRVHLRTRTAVPF